MKLNHVQNSTKKLDGRNFLIMNHIFVKATFLIQ